MPHRKIAASTSAHSGITRYLQLYTFLAQELADGRYAPGQPLPSEPDLVKQHALSRTTVRRALARLEREGRILRRRGSGTFARKVKAETRVRVPIEQLCELHRGGASMRTLRSGRTTAPAMLRHFDAAFREHVKITHRLYSAGGDTVRLEAIYSCAPQRTSKIESVRQEMSVSAADAFAARHLRVPAGTPVLRLLSEFRDSGNRLVAVSETLLRADRTSLQITLERQGNSESRWRLKPG